VFYAGKAFTFDAGHRLLSHPELCRHPHGHTYRLEVVVAAPQLDDNAMVCDYKALTALVKGVLAEYDHAMILAQWDPLVGVLQQQEERVVLLPEEPTAEVLARHLFSQLQEAFAQALENPAKVAPYRFRPEVKLVALRLWETPTTWAEFRPEP
jgi:6-pyruvoyltetrahydropterin/6-carboxytetrahydropterin synthase